MLILNKMKENVIQFKLKDITEYLVYLESVNVNALSDKDKANHYAELAKVNRDIGLIYYQQEKSQTEIYKYFKEAGKNRYLMYMNSMGASIWTYEETICMLYSFGNIELLNKLYTVPESVYRVPFHNEHEPLGVFIKQLIRFMLNQDVNMNELIEIQEMCENADMEEMRKEVLSGIKVLISLVNQDEKEFNKHLHACINFHEETATKGYKNDLVDGFICFPVMAMKLLAFKRYSMSTSIESKYAPFFILEQ